MPKGKGTYGSKVGRPPKKNKKDEYLFGGLVGSAKWLKEKLEKKKASKKKVAKKAAPKKAKKDVGVKTPVYSSKKDYSKSSKPVETKKTKVAKAKKDAANKSWSKATKSAKASGVKMTDLIKARNAAKKSGDKTAYAKAQNQINKHYGVKKKHKAPAKKETPKKDYSGSSAELDYKTDYSGESSEGFSPKLDEYGKGEEEKIKKEKGKSMQVGGMVDRPQYKGGGKVESGGLFDFPVKDARGRK